MQVEPIRIDHGTNDTTNYARLRVPNPEPYTPNRKERRKMAAVQRIKSKQASCPPAIESFPA